MVVAFFIGAVRKHDGNGRDESLTEEFDAKAGEISLVSTSFPGGVKVRSTASNDQANGLRMLLPAPCEGACGSNGKRQNVRKNEL